MRAFHENPNCIHTELNLLSLKAHNHKCMFLSSTKLFEASLINSVDPNQTAPLGAGSSLIWVHNVCLSAYVKYTFSDAVILLAFNGLNNDRGGGTR